MDKLSPTRSSHSESSPHSIKTYFYVFVDYLDQPAFSGGTASSESGKSQESLDSVVSAAFQRFKLMYPEEARVYVNRQPYNEIRKLFGIQELPAFGISDVDLAGLVQQGQVSSMPPNLPSVWNIFKWRKRKTELESGKY